MTMTQTITPMSQRVMARLPGADLATVNIEMRAAANEFLARTLIWRSRVAFTAIPGVNAYPLISVQPQAGVMISRVLAAYYGKTPISVGSLMTGYDFTVTGAPQVLDASDPSRIVVWPTPVQETTEHEITMDVAWAVDPSSIEPESVVLPFSVLGYIEAISDGALARLYAMPDKPWSSQKHADFHMRKFRVSMVQARRTAEAARGRENGHAVPRWRFPRFA